MRGSHTLTVAVLAAGASIFLGSCTTPLSIDRGARAPQLDGFGTVAMTATADPVAQRLFARGVLQSYAFNDEEAARAYKAALAVDPRCVLCAWGVAKAAGPNINNVERGDLSDARRHLVWALRHAEGASARDRALVDALVDRYGAEPVAGTPAAAAALATAGVCSGPGTAKAHPLDIVYAARMRTLADAHPEDVDVLVLYAEAAMIATRADWWDKKSGAPAGEIGVVADRLERALRAHPDHPGLNHFLIHAVDSSPRPERALAAADRLGAIAPQSPHLIHMPAHIYVRIGRYHDAVRVNEEAIEAQLRQDSAIAAQGFKAKNNWNFHNRHFLWFSALTEGRGEIALEQARVLADSVATTTSANGEFVRALPLLTLVRLERWDDVLGAATPSGDAGIARPIADYAAGLALVRVGRTAAARQRAALLQGALDAPSLRGKTLMGEDPARTILDILSRHLQGEIALADGNAEGARVVVGAGTELEAGLDASEPPLLGSMTRLALGDLMLRAGRWPDAEHAYRAELLAQPGSGWALLGLQRALERQGRADEARRAREDGERAWASADASLRLLAQR
jgi:tetratricopeptide (TPR) repeat protein